MDLNNLLTNDPEELVVRGTHKNILWFAILMTIPCVGILTDTYENWKKFITEGMFSALFLISLIYGGAIYGWIKVFDKRIKLIINRNGIWYFKTKFIDWTNILSFEFKEQKTVKAGTFTFLKLKTTRRDKAYKIDITLYNKTLEEIQEAINKNAIKYPVQYLGLET